MNLDEYRAMKAQDAAQNGQTTSNQTATQTTPEPTPAPAQTTQETPTHIQAVEPTTQTDKITVNGKEYTPEQIAEFEKGYLRQQDYTKKSQEVAAQRRQVEQAVQLFQTVTSNPELQQSLVEKVPSLDPQAMQRQELEHKLYDAKVENEVLTLQQKYPDFDAREAMKVAVERKLPSLEDAYLLSKATQTQSAPALNIDELKAQLLAELKQETAPAPNTSSIITTNSGSAPVQDTTPKLSAAQMAEAQKWNMKPDEYAKWAQRK